MKLSFAFFAKDYLPSIKKPQIVILGSGWGSYRVLKNINKNLYDVKVVTPRNHFLFTPLLCSTAVGTLEFRSIIEPVRNVGFDDPKGFMLAHAEKLDIKKQEIICRSVLDKDDVFALPYDKLVIGVGCLSNTFGIPGVKQYAHFLKEIKDARNIRSKIISNCEKALCSNQSEEEVKRLLHTVIVGGGPTGVELGAELYDFVREDLKRLYRYGENLLKVTLVEEAKILASFDKKLRDYAERKIRQRTNFTLLRSSVVEVKEDRVVLKDGTSLPCGLVVWSAGLSQRIFTKAAPLKKSAAGRILIDNHLRALGDSSGNVYALGDCAEIDSDPLPCTAQVAERQGKYLADCLNKKREEPFIFESEGMLAYIGDREAITDFPDLKVYGFTSWLLWRSAYWTTLVSWRLRVQVPIDWIKTSLFGRDTSHFF